MAGIVGAERLQALFRQKITSSQGTLLFCLFSGCTMAGNWLNLLAEL